LVVCFFHVEVLSLSHQVLWQPCSHQVLELSEDSEQFLSKDRQILLFKKLGIYLTQLVKLWVDLIFWDRALVSNEVLQISYLCLVLLLEVINVLLRNLNITLKLKDVNEVLSLVGQLLLVVVDLVWSSWVLHFGKDIEEHGILVRLLHDFSDFIVKVIE
jgi:hypothetical protein